MLAASAARLRELRCTRMSMIFQEPMTALNPVMRCGDQIDEVLATHTQARRRRSAARRCCDIIARRAPARARAHDRVVPAPALGRPAPAHHDRDGAGARSRAADRRRADDRARRHHAGADPRADPRAAGARTAPACCSSPTTSAWSPRSPIASSCCAGGELVEMGRRDEILRAPAHDYTRMLIAVGAEPRAAARTRESRRRRSSCAPRARRKTYARRAWLGKAQRRGAAAADVDLEIRARRDARHRRRIGLGQVARSRAASRA